VAKAADEVNDRVEEARRAEEGRKHSVAGKS
jgi:hypothetical protein